MFEMSRQAVKTGIPHTFYGPARHGSTLQECPAGGGNLQIGGDCRRRTPGERAVGKRLRRRSSYTVDMDSETIERLEIKIAFLERANAELSDVLYRQQQDIQELRVRLDALTQQVLAGPTAEAPRTLEDERPPHY